MNAYLDANLAWHLAVVRASHNELLVSFMEVLSAAIHEATEIEAFDSTDLRASTLKIHRAILAAIAAGDADAARRRMLRHVSAARDVALHGDEATPSKTVTGRSAVVKARPAKRGAGVSTKRRAGKEGK